MYPLKFLAINGGAFAGLALALAGCSMHPLPEDVAPASTYDIVQRIRCEVAEGLRDFPRNQTFKKIVDNTTIGYDFTFKITEKDSAAGGTLEFKRPPFIDDSKGFFLELTGGASKKRENTRLFRIIEGLAEVNETGCAAVTKHANPLYPITGATGMGEVVRTYVRLEMLTDVAKAANKDVFSDALQFTTKFSAGAVPNLELGTVAGTFKLTKASLTGSASREDVHNVTVALSRDKDNVDFAASMRTPELMTVVVEARTLRRLLQKQTAGGHNRVFLELERRRLVDEDRRFVLKVLLGTD